MRERDALEEPNKMIDRPSEFEIIAKRVSLGCSIERILNPKVSSAGEQRGTPGCIANGKEKARWSESALIVKEPLRPCKTSSDTVSERLFIPIRTVAS